MNYENCLIRIQNKNHLQIRPVWGLAGHIQLFVPYPARIRPPRMVHHVLCLAKAIAMIGNVANIPIVPAKAFHFYLLYITK